MKETKSLACLLAIGTAAAVAIVQFRQLSPGHTRSAISDRGETDQRTAPLSRAAVLLIVDKSGSMAGRNMELVKEACINTANCLSPNDVIAVVGFDYNAILVLDFTAADRSGHIEQRIRRLLASGGTRIYPALALALRIFEDDPHARQSAAKHAILVSDGDAPPADYETVVRKMTGEGVTLSTICFPGPRFDAVLMSQIASWGKGRFKFTDNFNNVPQLILNEVKQVLESLPKRD